MESDGGGPTNYGLANIFLVMMAKMAEVTLENITRSAVFGVSRSMCGIGDAIARYGGIYARLMSSPRDPFTYSAVE